MITKTDFIEALKKECDICIHLFRKIPEGGMEYRPSPEQRNTLELLKYLSFHAIGFTRALVEGSWEPYQEYAGEAENLNPDGFIEAMEKQKRMLVEYISTIPDDDVIDKMVTVPSGETFTMGRSLLDMTFRCLSGYRMQLFLYVKASGNYAINTANCWAGADADFQ